MKCSFCTYEHKPENPALLKAHAELEFLEGNTNYTLPVVVWRDGGFLLVLEPADGEQLYDIGIKDRRPKEDEIVNTNIVFDDMEEIEKSIEE